MREAINYTGVEAGILGGWKQCWAPAHHPLSGLVKCRGHVKITGTLTLTHHLLEESRVKGI